MLGIGRFENKATCHRTREMPNLPSRPSTSTGTVRRPDLACKVTACQIPKVDVAAIATAIEVLRMRNVFTLVLP